MGIRIHGVKIRNPGVRNPGRGDPGSWIWDPGARCKERHIGSSSEDSHMCRGKQKGKKGGQDDEGWGKKGVWKWDDGSWDTEKERTLRGAVEEERRTGTPGARRRGRWGKRVAGRRETGA